MSREEAVDKLNQMYGDWRTDEEREAIEVAIEALNAEPCNDCISRQAVLGVIEREEFKGDAISEIEKLPHVKPEQKIGRWVITDDDLVYCSECEDSYYSRPIDASWYYCPNCGAKMEGEDDN